MAKKRPAGRPAGNPARAAAPRVDDVAATLSSYGDPLDEVRGYAADRRELDALLADAVLAARRQGATWTDLGRALGVTPQAVQKRYGSRSA